MDNGKRARDAVVLSTARTPQGKFLGSLESFTAVELGRTAVKAAVERAGINAAEVDELILGNVVQAGVGQAPARQVWVGLNYPSNVGGVTINKVCGSGLKAAMFAASAIKAGDGDLYVAGGMESMSNAPFLDTQRRKGSKYGHAQILDSLQNDGLWCHLCDWSMGEAAEFIADQLEVTREAMDHFAYQSHQRAQKATEDGCFQSEIVPVEIQGKRGDVTVINRDEAIRADTSIEALAKLKPAFRKEGRVTAGNAPGMNDGAAAVVVASRDYAEANGHQPVARIVAYGQAAVDSAWLFYAPVKAIPIALAKAGWTMEDVDLFEINEAFAAQVLADVEGLKRDGYTLPLEKLNIYGGAIALGHPIGASGTRVLVTLINALRQNNLKRGIASLCLGGSEAVAMAVEL
ncbi:MAG: acetyl-CoA C-acyltransferase, partial [Anaerolineae bacterium]|nr:acetyl-CoA C-acyltransferase [Anaerolineae bacterium]